MGYEQILTETRGRVGVIRLNRPEKLNSWTSQMAEEIQDQLGKWNADAGIGAILMTGERRAFCARLTQRQLGQGHGSRPARAWTSHAAPSLRGLCILALQPRPLEPTHDQPHPRLGRPL